MKNQLKRLSEAGGKPARLRKLIGLLAHDRTKTVNTLLAGGLSAAAHKKLQLSLGELTLFRAELNAHGAALLRARQECQHGLKGTAPDDWAATNDGEPYEAHQEVAHTLACMPGRGKGLSPALLEFFNKLPNRRRESFANDVTQAATMAPYLKMLGLEVGGLGDLTPHHIGDGAQSMATDSVEKMLFLTSYADDLAEALALAEAGGDLKKIHNLIY